MSEQNENVGTTEQRVFSRKQAAEYLGVGLATVDRALAAKDITVSRLRGRVVFKKESLEEYLNRNECRAKSKRVPRGLLSLER